MHYIDLPVSYCNACRALKWIVISISSTALSLRERNLLGRIFVCSDLSYQNQYAGDETPDWITWKIRTKNAVKRICSDHSPAHTLAVKGERVRTEWLRP